LKCRQSVTCYDLNDAGNQSTRAEDGAI
jgi:hypothetical protein